MPVTIKDIARRTGVSPATVSRALAENPSFTVSARTRDRIREAAQSLGYVRNEAARRLAQGGGGMIGILPALENHLFYQRLTWMLREAMVDAGLFPLQVHYREPLDGGSPAVPGWPMDGAIVAHSDRQWAETIPELRRRGVPVVAITADPEAKGDRVIIDQASIGRQAAEHLIELGHKEVGIVAPQEFFDAREPRLMACEEAYAERGLKTLRLLPRDWLRGDVRAFITGYLDSGQNLPRALFCFNDETAIGVVRGVYDRGRRVADDVAVIGVDGMPEGVFHTPSLTSVEHPTKEACRLAVEMLQRRLAEPDCAEQVVTLVPRLWVGESTAGR